MSARTVKVSNVSLGASLQDIKEFFSFSGDIDHVELKSDDEHSQIAYITFKDSQGAETALLLSGATIVDLCAIITLAEDYVPPPPAITASNMQMDPKSAGGAESVIKKAEDVVTAMLARGFILGKDVLNKAKEFDEKHQLTRTASAKVASFDKRIGLTEKVTMGSTAVNEKVKEMDEKFQVSIKTKSAIAVAEEKVSTAGSSILSNRFIVNGVAWVTSAFSKAAMMAGDVGSKLKARVISQQEPKGDVKEEPATVNQSEALKPSSEESPKPPSTEAPSKPPAEGLIL